MLIFNVKYKLQLWHNWCIHFKQSRGQASQQTIQCLSLSFFRSLPKQGHALGWRSAVASGYDVQHQQPLFELSNARRDTGTSQQLQQLHVCIDVSVRMIAWKQTCLLVVPQSCRDADRAAEPPGEQIRPQQDTVTGWWPQPVVFSSVIVQSTQRWENESVKKQCMYERTCLIKGYSETSDSETGCGQNADCCFLFNGYWVRV